MDNTVCPWMSAMIQLQLAHQEAANLPPAVMELHDFVSIQIWLMKPPATEALESAVVVFAQLEPPAQPVRLWICLVVPMGSAVVG